MTTANDFAKAGQAIGQLADRINPPDTDKYAQSRKVAVFHLRSAALKMREIAEALAKQERPNGTA